MRKTREKKSGDAVDYNEKNNKDSCNHNSDFNIRNYLDMEDMTEEEIDRCEFWISAHRKVRESGLPNYQGERIQVNNKWNLELLGKQLDVHGYEDMELIQLLRYSWPLNAQDTEVLDEIPDNQRVVKENKEEAIRYLKQERENGSIIGPFHTNPFETARFSPLNTREKKQSVEKRVILNLSYPFKGGSVNASINKTQYLGRDINLRYPTPDDLSKIILKKRTSLQNLYTGPEEGLSSVVFISFRHKFSRLFLPGKDVF